MKLIKITAGRHHAWFNKTFVDGVVLPVRKPYIPPEGCHKGCGLRGEPQKPEPQPKPQVAPVFEVPVARPSWWKRVLSFVRRLFKGRVRKREDT